MAASENKKERNKKRPLLEAWFSVAVVTSAFITMCTFFTYSYGNMAPYIISYTRVHSLDPAKNAVTMSEAAWLCSSLSFMEGVFFALGGWLSDTVGTRSTALVGSVILTTSTLLAAGAIQISYWAAVFVLAVVHGTGSGLAYMAALGAIAHWVPNHVGLATGVALVGLGSSSAFIPIQTAIINPSNEMPNLVSGGFHYFTQEDILRRVPIMFIVLSSILAGLQVASVPFLVEYRDENPPSERSCLSIAKYIWTVVKPKPFERCSCLKKQVPEHYPKHTSTIRSSPASLDISESSSQIAKDPESDQKSSSCASDQDNSVSPWQLVKRLEFYVLGFGMFAVTFSTVCIEAFYKVQGQNLEYDDNTLAIIGSFSAVANSTGRLVWGILADKMPPKLCLALVLTGISSFMYTLQAASLVGAWMYGVWVSVIFCCIGGSFTLFPAFVLRTYGKKHYTTNYGLVHLSCTLGSVAPILISTYGYHCLHWEGICLTSASLLFVAVAATICL